MHWNYKTCTDDVQYPCFLQFLWAQVANQGAYGGRWSGQVVWTIPNTLPLRGSWQEHGGPLVGRVSLTPLFLAGNSTQTITYMFSKRKDSGLTYDCGDAGSNVYEVNPWLWQRARQTPPGRPDHRPEYSEQGCCERCTAQACSITSQLQPYSK